MKIPTKMPHLKGYRFPREVVAYAVWVYDRFALSAADVEDLLAERDVTVSRGTVLKSPLNRWAHVVGMAGRMFRNTHRGAVLPFPLGPLRFLRPY
jgi:putative transposase